MNQEKIKPAPLTLAPDAPPARPGTVEGVALKPLKNNVDERGFFREVARQNNEFFKAGFELLTYSLLPTGTTKAWHIHPSEVAWWYVPIGSLKVALYDNRPGSATFGNLMEFRLGEDQPTVLKIPPGVAHGYKSTIQTQLVYITGETYEVAEEGHIPSDHPVIGYDWTA